MDVTRTTLLGRTPVSRVVGAGGSPQAPTSVMVRGTREGPDYVLPSGVRIRCMTIGGAHVTTRELQEALQGVAQLPLADQQLVARAGVAIELVPVAALENGILGATAVDELSNGSLQPQLIRVVVRSPLSNRGTGRERIGEIVQHEVGHVVSVLRTQDRSEQAAEAYAAAH
jgi:hypothetical protein